MVSEFPWPQASHSAIGLAMAWAKVEVQRALFVCVLYLKLASFPFLPECLHSVLHYIKVQMGL